MKICRNLFVLIGILFFVNSVSNGQTSPFPTPQISVEFNVYDANPEFYRGIDLDNGPIYRPAADRLLDTLFSQEKDVKRIGAVADGATELFIVVKFIVKGDANRLDIGGHLGACQATPGYPGHTSSGLTYKWRDRYKFGDRNWLPTGRIPFSSEDQRELITPIYCAGEPEFRYDGVNSTYYQIYKFKVPPQLQNGDYAQDVEFTIHEDYVTFYYQEKEIEVNSHPIQLYRPPVLLVHGLWSSGDRWLESGDPYTGSTKPDPYGSMRAFLTYGAQLQTYAIDYSDTNASSFETNKDVIWKSKEAEHPKNSFGILDIIIDLRSRQIAVTRVDVVGHSMGGILTRKFLETPNGQPNRENFFKGRIRRFITIDTPHLGTPMANLLIKMSLQTKPMRALYCNPLLPCDEYTTNGQRFKELTAFEDIPVDQGAVADLQSNSNAIGSLSSSNVKSFAISGEIDEDNGKYYSGITSASWLYYFLGMEVNGIDNTSLLSFYRSVFGNERADAIVPSSSQAGGLVNHNSIFQNIYHGPAIDNKNIQYDVARLLLGDESVFADGIPSPNNGISKQSKPSQKIKKTQENIASIKVENNLLNVRNSGQISKPTFQKISFSDNLWSKFKPIQYFNYNNLKPNNYINSSIAPESSLITITSPANGQEIPPGVDLNISVVPKQGANIKSLLFTIGQLNENFPSVITENQNYGSTLKIPNNLAGKIPITVFAADQNGQVDTSTIEVNVRPHEPLTSIEAPQNYLFFDKPGSKKTISIVGTYSSGIQRNIKSSVTGTQYSSDNPNVASVDSEGIVNAHSNGLATITIINGSVNTTVSVKVEFTLPYINLVNQTSIPIPSNSVNVDIYGYNLWAVNDLKIYRNGALDPTANINNFQYDVANDVIHAQLTVSSNAIPGDRSVVVFTPIGSSSISLNNNNKLAIGTIVSPTPTPKFNVSGIVTLSSLPLSNVIVVAQQNGATVASSRSDSNGSYILSLPSGQNYSILPSISGFSFTPTSQTITNLSSNQIINFNATSAGNVISPPDTFIDIGPNEGEIIQSNRSFYWLGRDDITPANQLNYQYQLDNNGWSTQSLSTLSITFNYQDLADGQHTFQVRAIDAEGNIDQTPASRSFIVYRKTPNMLINFEDLSPGLIGDQYLPKGVRFYVGNGRYGSSTGLLLQNGVPVSASVRSSSSATSRPNHLDVYKASTAEFIGNDIFVFFYDCNGNRTSTNFLGFRIVGNEYLGSIEGFDENNVSLGKTKIKGSGTPVGYISPKIYSAKVSYGDMSSSFYGFDDFRFNQSACLPKPIISNLNFTNITSTSATVNWTSDQNTTGLVEFAVGTGNFIYSANDSNNSTHHSINLNQLISNTNYRIKITATNDVGQQTTSEDFIFTTLSGGQEYTISGQLTYKNQPLPGMRISAILPNGNVGASATTDANGVYNLSLAAGGTYTITVGSSGFNFPVGQTFTNLNNNQIQNFNATITTLLISEFRLHGNNSTDDFVELYNATDSVADISGYSIVSSDNPTIPKFIAPGEVGSKTTTIPARGHFLITGAGYSLGNYAQGDGMLNADIPDNAGVGLFLSPAIISPSTKVDAVGFKPQSSPFTEGAALDPVNGISNNGEISFVRNFGAQGYPVDTDNNPADFSFVSTDAGIYNGFQTTLGAPGPENRLSPIFKPNSIITSVFDSGAGISAAPNKVTNTANTGAAPLGTIASRRTYTNNTGSPITKFRIRIIGISTLGSPKIYNPQSVVKALNSADISVQKADGSVVQVKGLTVESPSPVTGGGLNSSLLVTLNQPINPGENINVDTVIGVFANGRLIFNTLVETDGQ